MNKRKMLTMDDEKAYAGRLGCARGYYQQSRVGFYAADFQLVKISIQGPDLYRNILLQIQDQGR